MEITRPDHHLTDGVVVLRPLAEDDVPRIVEACQDPDTVRWTRVPTPYDRSHATWFVRAAASGDLPDDEITVAIASADEVRLLGVVGVRPDAIDRRAELGYWAHPDARGRGVVTRAVAVACRWCLDDLDLQRVTAVTSVHNEASVGVLRRNGFTCEATLRRHLSIRGEFHDAHLFGLLAGELTGPDPTG